MWRYIVKRLLLMIPVLIGVTFMVFFIMSLTKGDAAMIVAGEEASEEELEAVREELGLNDPLVIRWGRYVLNLMQGDLDLSYITDEPVWDMYIQRIPNTFLLACCAMLVALAIALPLGITASTHQNSMLDTFSMVLALVGVSMPTFWLGLLLMMVFSLKLGWLPSNGFDSWKSVILPALTEGMFLVGLMTRTTRSAMLDTLRSDYMTTALAKGVSKWNAIMKHGFRNALIPIVTTGGMQFVYVMAGTVAVERIFAWPGIGRQVITSIGQRDNNVVTGFVIMTSIMVCVVQLLMDVAYAFLDPRIKAMYAVRKTKK